MKCGEVVIAIGDFSAKVGCGEHLYLLDNLVLEVEMKEEVDFCNFVISLK